MVNQTTNLETSPELSYLENKFLTELRELASLTIRYKPLSDLEIKELKEDFKKEEENNTEQYHYESYSLSDEYIREMNLKLENVTENLLIQVINDVLKKQQEVNKNE